METDRAGTSQITVHQGPFWFLSPLGHEVVVRGANTDGPVDLDATIHTWPGSRSAFCPSGRLCTAATR